MEADEEAQPEERKYGGIQPELSKQDSTVSTVSTASTAGMVLDGFAPNEQKLARIYEFLHKYLLESYKAGKFSDETYTSPKSQQY